MKRLSSLVLAAAVATVALAPITAQAEKVGSANFSGIVSHISTNNIKVTNAPAHQSMSFLIVPKFDQVFSADGKTTYQMKRIKAGQYVKVYYDQKFFGQRHADRILVLSQANQVKHMEK